VLGRDVKNQDLFALYFPLINYRVQPQAWELFKSDFPAIIKKVDGPDAVGLAQVAGAFCDARLRDDFRCGICRRKTCRATWRGNARRRRSVIFLEV
jgi:hypothetical protein